MKQDQGFADGIPADEYHQVWPAWSSTNLRATLVSAARGLASREGRIGSKAGQLEGTIRHALLFEPLKFAKEFVMMASGQRRAKKEVAYQKLLKTGKTPIKPEEYFKANQVVEAVMEDPLWQGVASPAMVAERSWWWTDEETGVPCKARTDGFEEFPDRNLILDLKPAPGDRDFGNFVYNKGYHIQAALYCRGVKQITGKPCDFMIVSHSDTLEINFDLICTSEAQTLFHQLGDASVNEALQRIKLCSDTDIWPGRNEGRVKTLEPPRWALRELEDLPTEQEPF